MLLADIYSCETKFCRLAHFGDGENFLLIPFLCVGGEDIGSKAAGHVLKGGLVFR